VKVSDPKALFPRICKSWGVPTPECEYAFAREIGRRWRFDYCWPEYKVALECDGGVYTQGRHVRGSGWMKDSEKLNAACGLGWRMLRCTPSQLCTDEMMDVIKQALAYEEVA
jgi:very-short-patch-repair endonuclease